MIRETTARESSNQTQFVTSAFLPSLTVGIVKSIISSQRSFQSRAPSRCQTRTCRNRGRRSFTLVELLTVVAAVGILAGLILAATSGSRFRSQVAVCTNNDRQWGIAIGLYASDDSHGRLPSYPLPADKMTTYRQLEPWFVPYEIVTNMAVHGVTVPMWFCPTRPEKFQIHRDNFQHLRERELVSSADLVDEFWNIQKSLFVFPDLFWWVPRKLGTSSLEWPDPQLLVTRTSDPWPRRMDDPTFSRQPFLSDWIIGAWDVARNTGQVPTEYGGHAWSGAIKNSNSAYADGHVETRPKSQLQWQAKGPGNNVYVY